jgi:hypothetical protein
MAAAGLMLARCFSKLQIKKKMTKLDKKNKKLHELFERKKQLIPRFFDYNGFKFELSFFQNNHDEWRICYELISADEWPSTLNGGRYCDFLFLYENIKNRTDLKSAIYLIKKDIKKINE